VTFPFTDVDGSARLWEQHPEAMRDALARHDEILRGLTHNRNVTLPQRSALRRGNERCDTPPTPFGWQHNAIADDLSRP
jgi:class 3 adenylate cyclase